MIEQILVVTDDSPAGMEALQRAVELAGQFAATLRVIHVPVDSDVTTALLASGAARLAPACPAVSCTVSGEQCWSVRAWILVVNPPRERPMA